MEGCFRDGRPYRKACILLWRENNRVGPNAKPGNPNVSRSNILRVGHVHVMLFASCLLALGCQRERDFCWNMGLRESKLMPGLIVWNNKAWAELKDKYAFLAKQKATTKVKFAREINAASDTWKPFWWTKNVSCAKSPTTARFLITKENDKMTERVTLDPWLAYDQLGCLQNCF